MSQSVHIAKNAINAHIDLPGSKSITNRALLLASLADGVSELSGIQVSNDTKTLINAMHQAGIVVQLDEEAKSCIVAGGSGRFPKKQASLWCGDMTVASHFLIAVCATSPSVYYFDGEPALREVILDELLSLLCRQGAQIIPNDANHLPFTLIGADGLEGGDIIYDLNSSSMLISALLMIAPYARSPFNFTTIDTLGQQYIDMSCSIMAEFGVLVRRLHQGQLMVPVPQRYQARDYMVEPDFSLGAYFFAAAAATGGKLTIQNIKRSLIKQYDIKCLSILEKMGCVVEESRDGLNLTAPTALQGVEVSLRDFSDIFLMLIALAPFAKSPTRINYINPARGKEAARISKIKLLLEKMEIQVESGTDWIKIYPGTPKACQIDASDDYHIAMAACILGLKTAGMTIEHPESITHVYPEFFQLWDQLTNPSADSIVTSDSR